MSRFVMVVLVLVVLGCAWAAPADEKDTKAEGVVDKTDKKTSADDRAVVVNDGGSSWGSLMDQSTWTIVSGSVATLFLIGGLALGFYYFYYLNYYGYSGNVDSFSGYQQSPAANPNYYSQYGQYYQSAARALQGNSFNFARVLDMIAMAQETYEKFDFQSIDCQKKALCELQQKQADFGETGRKISSTFSFMDTLEGLPMPAIIQAYLKEYKEAIMQGKNSSKECSAIYPKCGFSIKEVFVKYTKKAHKQQ